MIELTKERIQQIWDYELIKGWDENGKCKMWRVVHSFMCRIKGDHEVGSVSFEDTEDYLVSLELKRCLDINHQLGYHVFRAWRTDVIGFIHARCEKMSLDLINEVPKPVILIDINKYKWTKKDTNSAAKHRRKQAYDKKKGAANLEVKARSLSKKHDWTTTK